MTLDLLNTHQFIEASAGTGKTYTIEQLFVRRLMEPMPDGRFPRASEIAALTFTRAVARELALRIRKRLELAITEEKNRATKERLQTALGELESSCITTIHGFCFKMLGDYSKDEGCASYEQAMISSSQMANMVEDFLSTELPTDRYTVQQVALLLDRYRCNFRSLSEAIIEGLHKHWFLDEPHENNQQLVEKLLSKLTKSSDIFSQLEALAQNFTGCLTKEGALKADVENSFRAFSQLFGEHPDVVELIRTPFTFSSIFASLKKGKTADVSFFLSFDPLIKALSDPETILKRLVLQCRDFVRRQMKQKQLFSYDEILFQMAQALDDDRFCRYVSDRFSYVFVDEFQDTDPLQWKIITKGFLERKKTYVALIGDPKQSIYAFRRADVYSYLQAKKELPGAVHSTLSTNYRSTASLVKALNTFFSNAQFLLPKLQESLPVPTVSAAKEESYEAAIHFFVAEGSIGRKRSWPTEELEQHILFPFIAEQILKIGPPYSQFAILVKDRYQAEDVETYLTALNIPATCWKRPSVVVSRAFLLLERLIAHISSPRDRGKLMRFLTAEPFFSSELVGAESLTLWAEYVERATEWKRSFDEGGLAALFSHFLDEPMKEKIVSLPQGIQLLRDLEYLFELLAPQRLSLRALLKELVRLKELPESEKEALSCRFDPQEDAVQIVTIHSSKGLEFDIVFALGAASRSSPSQDLEQQSEKLRQLYVACTRAKKHLYLPLVIESDQKAPGQGTESPLECYLGTLLESAKSVVEKSEGTIELIFALPKPLQPIQRKEAHVTAIKQEIVIESSPVAYSFSSLKAKEEAPLLIKPQEVSELPRGPEIGTVFHQILQRCVQKGGFDRSIVEDELYGSVLQGYEMQVSKLVQEAFEIPLTGFSLNDVDLTKAFCEMEFYYEEAPKKIMRGVIDLVFEKEGVTYLLDWKSNWLEPEEGGVQKLIHKHNYDLQAKIYAKAWRRYLASCKSTKKFGGFFFLFLRAGASGVYFFTPEEL